MAYVKNNPILAGVSGKLGNLVYRQMNGKTIVQCAPVRAAPYNEAQKKQQGRFQEAMAYARKLLADPEVKAEYTARAKAKRAGWNAFNLAVSEYLKGDQPLACQQPADSEKKDMTPREENRELSAVFVNDKGKLTGSSSLNSSNYEGNSNCKQLLKKLQINKTGILVRSNDQVIYDG